MDLKDRFFGAIMGSGIGDALGAPTEFCKEAEIPNLFGKRVVDYYSNRAFQLGEVTDDTQMMFCIARSLINSKDINLNEIADNFIYWYKKDGRGCGRLCRNAIKELKKGVPPTEAGYNAWLLTEKKSAGNGGVMRNACVPLFFMNDFDKLIKSTEDICKITHYDPRCVLSCKAHSVAMYALLHDKNPYDLVMANCSGIDTEFDEILNEAKNKKIIDYVLDEDNMGYTYLAILVGLSAIFNYDNFEEPIFDIVNKGGDADTNAAVAGGLLGAKYGINAIPKYLVEKFYNYDECLDIANKLYENHK
ncbi:MAG: ADP-ribosylglycohydrolase family protein [Abditibacteriota bacterium]|nr:ADP-ribosylglycohydrolase family protein [Abditibacteriota bacterium]